jgi:hypothetical protein
MLLKTSQSCEPKRVCIRLGKPNRVLRRRTRLLCAHGKVGELSLGGLVSRSQIVRFYEVLNLLLDFRGFRELLGHLGGAGELAMDILR